MHSEQLRRFSRVQKITGTGMYPGGVEELRAFELPLLDDELSKWIADGRQLARVQHERDHLVLVGGEPLAGVEGWSCAALALPADGVASAMLRRLRLSGKQAPPALTDGIATGVQVVKDIEDAADSGAGPSLGSFDIAGADTPPGGDVKPPVVKPNKFFDIAHLATAEGHSWVCLDPLRMGLRLTFLWARSFRAPLVSSGQISASGCM